MPAAPLSLVSGRRLILVAVAAAIVGALVVLSFTYAYHDPTPHGVRLAVAGPPAAAGKLATGLDHAAPGGFHVRSVPSAAAAVAALRDRDAVGGLVIAAGAHASASATILTTGANGASLTALVTEALTAVAGHAHLATSVRDVVPTPPADRSGLSAFLLELGLIIPSVIGSAGLYLVGLRARLWWRIAAGALFAALVGVFATLISDNLIGALTGAWAPTVGLAAFGALTFVLVVASLQATVGLAGTALAALVLLFFGNAVSGGSVVSPLLPDVYRQLSGWMPNNAIVSGVRSVVYFGGHGLGHDLLVLSLWSGAALLLLLVNDLLHLRRIAEAPERAAEIYATPGVRNLRPAVPQAHEDVELHPAAPGSRQAALSVETGASRSSSVRAAAMTSPRS